MIVLQQHSTVYILRSFIVILFFFITSTSSEGSTGQMMELEAITTSSERLINKQKPFQKKLTQMLAKKLYKKAQRKAKKQGKQIQSQAADFLALAGAIITISGILSIIFNAIGGIVVALVGLIIYTLATQKGGSIQGVFGKKG